ETNVSRLFCQIASVGRPSTALSIVGLVPGWTGAGGSRNGSIDALVVRSTSTSTWTVSAAAEPTIDRYSTCGGSSPSAFSITTCRRLDVAGVWTATRGVNLVALVLTSPTPKSLSVPSQSAQSITRMSEPT